MQHSKYPTFDNINQNIDIDHVFPAQAASRYQIIKELGHGAQGTVYLARTVSDQSLVAIKVLKIQSVKNWKQYDLFHREADVLSRLNIDGIAKLREACDFLDEAVPVALIVQDYIEGDSLQSFIAKGYRFRFSQLCQIILQLIDILRQLNDCDPPIVHRDIKPSNIIIHYDAETNEPKVHLIDFGAVANPQVKSGGSTVVGTYGYMAPEQLMGHATPKSDVYSLAIIAVYLMSGVPPEDLEVQDYHVLIDAHLEHLPHPVTAALRAMLAPNQDERLTDYDKLTQIFTALAKENFNDVPYILGDTQQTYKTEYSLKKVYDFRQPGNIELWQSLSDKTPRKVPKIKIKFESWNTFAGLFIGFIFTLGFIIYIIVNSYINLAVCVIPLTILIIIISVAIKQFLEQNAKKYFLKYARKSMATVVRINYQTTLFCYSNHSAPEWEIIYSFNPPDDSSPDPIAGVFRTKQLPQFLREGDIIPILYMTVPEHKDSGMNIISEYVLSKPYPIPICDDLFSHNDREFLTAYRYLKNQNKLSDQQ